MLEIVGLKAGYGAASVLHGVDFTLKQGQFVGLLGANNAGKSFELFPRLAERRSQMAGTLSGGEQQMLAIGRGLMGQPRILMLDEPSLGLSPLFSQIIFAALKKLHENGLTILCVEQNLNLTLAYSTWCVVLERGVIAVEGSGTELRDHPVTRRAYLGL